MYTSCTRLAGISRERERWRKDRLGEVWARTGAFHARFDSRRAELRGRDRCETSTERTDRCSSGTDDHDFLDDKGIGSSFSCSGEFTLRFGLLAADRWRTDV